MTRSRGSRRYQIAAVTFAALAVGAVFAVSAADNSTAINEDAGPTTRAATRSLMTTLKESGTVERVDQRLITFAAGEATRTSSPSTPQNAPASAAPSTAADPTEATPAQNAAPTDGQVEAAGQAVNDDPSPPTTEPEAAPSPTAPPAELGPPSTTTTQASRTTTPPTTALPTTTAGPSTSTTVEEADPITLTAILAVGATAERGTVLYAADDEPTAALYGTIPAWRELAVGVDAGGDVRQLEENLLALGYGSGITIDDSFTSATDSAVRAWESDLGRKDPDGRVEVGEIVFLSGPGDVLAHEADLGDPVEPGDPILQLGSRQLVLKATVDANDAAVWAPGTVATLTWDNGETSQATVFDVSREVADGTVEVVIALADADGDRPTGSTATIVVADVRRDDVVAVPVAAIVASLGGGDAVRVPAADGAGDRIVSVKLGIVADGWAEIIQGIEQHDEVRLPG